MKRVSSSNATVARGTGRDCAMSVTSAPSPLRYRHASGLHAVTGALHALHYELLRSTGDDRNQVRTSVMNLVAACTDRSRGDGAAADLLRIGMRHPARAIIIVANAEHEPQLEADLSLHSGVDDNRVCTELVRLEVQGEPAYHLISIVAPLLIPDMPVYLWVVGASPLQQPFTDEVIALVERIILDSGEYADVAETLALLSSQLEKRGGRLPLADVAWQRTQLWRELIAQAFDPAAARAWLRNISDVSIRCAGSGASSDSWLLGGWMGSRLGWTRGRSPRLSIAGDGAPHATENTPAIALLDRLTEVRIHAQRGDDVAEVSLERRGDSIHTSIDIPRTMSAARTVSLPRRDEADLLSSMMAEGGDDAVYRAAIANAAALAAAWG